MLISNNECANNIYLKHLPQTDGSRIETLAFTTFEKLSREIGLLEKKLITNYSILPGWLLSL